jgi:site-specific DNA-methyltransferase (adenine-specific)
MVCADPPYGTTACKWDSIIPLAPMWEHLKRVIKPNGAIVMTASQPFTTTLISSNMGMFKYCWVWEKPQGVDPFMAKFRPLNNIEDVVIFGKNRLTYNPQLNFGTPYSRIRDKESRVNEITGATFTETTTENSGDRLPTRIIRLDRETGLHPTQKPTALMQYLIKTYTNEGDTVLDFCMGSGTTGVACVRTDRDFIGIEKDPEYFEVAKKRIELAQLEPRQLDLI